MAVAVGELTDVKERTARSPLAVTIRRLLRKRIASVAIVLIILFYLTGIFANFLAPRSYTEQDLNNVLQPPSLAHPFGTDRLGRDMLSRVIWASRTTVIITVATVVTGQLVIGVGLGLLAGYRGGWTDTIIMRVGEVIASLPALPMLIVIRASFAPKMEGWNEFFTRVTGVRGSGDYFLIGIIFALIAWVGTARIIRSQVLAEREKEYVLAARAQGASLWRIIWVHIFPNVRAIIIVGISASLAGIAGSEIALTWFGVGIQPPQPSFGEMLASGGSVNTLKSYPHLLLVPGAIVAILFYSFNLLGDALNDVLTPKAR
jgi:ABC-type dipeptide/oligopeptide/nickel transport system permease subunit